MPFIAAAATRPPSTCAWRKGSNVGPLPCFRCNRAAGCPWRPKQFGGWLAALAMGPMVTKQTSLGNGSETQQQGGRKTAEVTCTTHGRASLTQMAGNRRILYPTVKQRRRPRLPQNMAHVLTLSKNEAVIFEESVRVEGISMKMTIPGDCCRWVNEAARFL